MFLDGKLREIDSLITPTVEGLGFELIEIEHTNEQGRWILRLYIDLPGGAVNLDDCVKVSRTVGAILDVEDALSDKYNLEVSSPGIERPVRREKDFKKYAGSIIRIRTRNKINDRKNFMGVLKGMENGLVKIDENGIIFQIPVANILRARLAPKSEAPELGRKNFSGGK